MADTIEKLIIKIQADITDAQGKLDKIQSDVGNVETKTSGMSAKSVVSWAAVGTAIAAVGMKLASYAVDVGKAMFDVAADTEQYVQSLKVLYGSQEAATEQMQWIMDFAKSTPFEVSGLVDASIKLKSAGQEAQDVLQTLGDTAAASGKDVDQAVNAWIKLTTGQTGEAVNMFRDLGVNLKNITELKWDAQGSLVTPLEEAMPLIQAYLDETYGGMMDAQSQTSKGIMSNIQDTLSQASLAIMGFNMTTMEIIDGGLYDTIKKTLSTLLEYINRIDFVAVGQTMTTVFKVVVGIIGDVTRAFKGMDITLTIDLLKALGGAILWVFQTLEKYDVFYYMTKGVLSFYSVVNDSYVKAKDIVIKGINQMIDAYNKLVPLLQTVGFDVQAIGNISASSMSASVSTKSGSSTTSINSNYQKLIDAVYAVKNSVDSSSSKSSSSSSSRSSTSYSSVQSSSSISSYTKSLYNQTAKGSGVIGIRY